MRFKTRLSKIYYYRLGFLTVEHVEYKASNRDTLKRSSFSKTAILPEMHKPSKRVSRLLKRKFLLTYYSVYFFATSWRTFYKRRMPEGATGPEYRWVGVIGDNQKASYKSRIVTRYSKSLKPRKLRNIKVGSGAAKCPRRRRRYTVPKCPRTPYVL